MDDKNIYIKEGRFIYLSDYNIIINKEIEKELLKNNSFSKFGLQDIIISKATLRREVQNIDQLQFEVTQNCNLECKYCVYGKHYNRRNKTDKKMDFSTAKSSIDYIYNIISKRHKKEFCISFYGGEPLLDIDFIEKTVRYAKNIFLNWHIKFLMTTNGTLLNQKIINFLIRNDFHLLISIDGPKEIHDKKRNYLNGKGSFRNILSNMIKLKNTNSLFYKNNVSISAVWSSDLSLIKIYDFFTQNEFVKHKKVFLATVDPKTKNYFRAYPFSEEETIKEVSTIISLIENKKKKNIKINSFEYDILKMYNSIEDRLDKRIFTTLDGSCLFNFKVFVDVDGKFHICHMVEESLPIGDAWNGYNFNRMNEIAESFTYLSKQYCKNCKYKFLCPKCYSHAIERGKIDINNFSCENRKISIQKQLEGYINYKIKYN